MDVGKWEGARERGEGEKGRGEGGKKEGGGRTRRKSSRIMTACGLWLGSQYQVVLLDGKEPAQGDLSESIGLAFG